MRSLPIIIFLSIILPLFGEAQVNIPDTNFRNCLRKKYPSVLNALYQLVPAKAAAYNDTLVCTSVKINSVEGLQYFTNVPYIDLTGNNISILPDISNLKKLLRLEVPDNSLISLPDLSKLKNLKELYAHRNNIISLPDLTGNDSLNTLYVHSNLLDTLPDLTKLKQLQVLQVVNNNLRYLPGIDQLTKLKNIVCWKNRLVTLPDLRLLGELQLLDAAKNNLTDFPQLAPKNKITDLYLDNNEISTIPYFSGYDSLKILRITNNNLTFKELLKITLVTDYSTKFKIFPQKLLTVGIQKMAYQNEKVYLSTGVDQQVPEVYYEWYKNGNLIGTVSNDTFLIDKIAFEDSGKYTCLLKQPALSSFYLQTDTFSLRVLPCIDLSNISLATTNIFCMKPGTLTVTGVKPIQKSLSYSLKSISSGKIFFSSTGVFTELTETDYKLSVQNDYQCEKTYSGNISLTIQPCNEAYITPNNDGDTDTIYFLQSGRVIIYDQRGRVVKTQNIPSNWDGTAKDGLVAQGYYTADINNGEEMIKISVIY